MKTKLILCLALALGGGAVGCRTSNASQSPAGQQSGAITDGLQMSLAVSMANPADPECEVAIQNVGKKDVCLNLGMMLANGEVMIPDKIHINLVDESGKNRELLLKSPLAISGRVDDYAVPLKTGSTYTIKLRLDQFWSPEKQEFSLRLKPGQYEISAQFQGEGAEAENADMKGMKLMKFWKGNLQSNTVLIEE